MKIDKTYSIKEGKWTKWSSALADAIKDFYSTNTLYPNILEANEYTFSQFDFLTNIMPDERQNVVIEDSLAGTRSLPNCSEKILLSGYNNNDADIDFAVDNQLADKEFRLVYDDDPEWDEPIIPEECPVNEYKDVCDLYSSVY